MIRRRTIFEVEALIFVCFPDQMAPLSKVLAEIKQHVDQEIERLNDTGCDTRAIDCIMAGESFSCSTGSHN